MMITLNGNPVSTQTVYKMRSFGKFVSMYMSKRGKDIKLSYQQQASEQWVGKPLEGNVEIDIKLYFGTKRKSDWDNFHKLSMDALSGIVWVDDVQIQKAVVEKFYDKDFPRIEIKIKEL